MVYSIVRKGSGKGSIVGKGSTGITIGEEGGALAQESVWSSISPTQPVRCFLKVAPALIYAHFYMIVFCCNLLSSFSFMSQSTTTTSSEVVEGLFI
ncbi:hypothetical protein Y032_0552g3333 [Ancylostoma ceylanicum]|nr:hypothetical protein Y032_0552g3333 [Ancylostoma ceylanicum]